MSSYLLAIWSDHNGNPWLRGNTRDRIGHVVRIGGEQMHLVDEFTSGGPLAHVACAPACIYSRLLDDGIATSMAKIEQAAGTGPRGTLFPGIESCLTQYGVGNRFVGSGPPVGWIMNPAGGRMVPPSEFPAYLAATQGGCIVMADPVAPKPKPIPLPTEDDPMFALLDVTNGGTHIWHENGLLVNITNSASVATLLALKNCGGRAAIDAGTLASLLATPINKGTP